MPPSQGPCGCSGDVSPHCSQHLPHLPPACYPTYGQMDLVCLAEASQCCLTPLIPLMPAAPYPSASHQDIAFPHALPMGHELPFCDHVCVVCVTGLAPGGRSLCLPACLNLPAFVAMGFINLVSLLWFMPCMPWMWCRSFKPSTWCCLSRDVFTAMYSLPLPPSLWRCPSPFNPLDPTSTPPLPPTFYATDMVPLHTFQRFVATIPWLFFFSVPVFAYTSLQPSSPCSVLFPLTMVPLVMPYPFLLLPIQHLGSSYPMPVLPAPCYTAYHTLHAFLSSSGMGMPYILYPLPAPAFLLVTPRFSFLSYCC